MTVRYKAPTATEDSIRLANDLKKWREKRDEELRKKKMYIYVGIFGLILVIACCL